MCDSLDIDVGTDNILNLLRVRILEGEGAGSYPDPLSWFGAESKHHWQDLALQFHHLWTGLQNLLFTCIQEEKKRYLRDYLYKEVFFFSFL